MWFKVSFLVQVTFIIKYVFNHIFIFTGDGEVPITCCGENVQNRYNRWQMYTIRLRNFVKRTVTMFGMVKYLPSTLTNILIVSYHYENQIFINHRKCLSLLIFFIIVYLLFIYAVTLITQTSAILQANGNIFSLYHAFGSLERRSAKVRFQHIFFSNKYTHHTKICSWGVLHWMFSFWKTIGKHWYSATKQHSSN